ncbi:hypothetical protein K5E40_00135 [Pseudomonas baetica]|uniref:hypothetical protein n=1 Tax=Pseudomonas TaxID=286 RepID=UPI001C8BF03C|nr:hypothetical protein [Pseudomonas baetica]MBX9404093.1 hypothetical protein [Pseudomonas baetica]
MPELKNFVAVDWRAGKDRIYFFFKDTNTYSRFNIGDNEVPAGYPSPVEGSWDTLNDVKNLRFGFTTTGFPRKSVLFDDRDILWLFSYQNKTPVVTWYNQDTDKVMGQQYVEHSMWHRLQPYFERIVGGTWWPRPANDKYFRFLLSDGTTVSANLERDTICHDTINENNWPGLSRYKHRIISVAQNDRTSDSSVLYIFLTNHEYLRYDMSKSRTYGPKSVNDGTWPGLLRD